MYVWLYQTNIVGPILIACHMLKYAYKAILYYVCAGDLQDPFWNMHYKYTEWFSIMKYVFLFAKNLMKWQSMENSRLKVVITIQYNLHSERLVPAHRHQYRPWCAVFWTDCSWFVSVERYIWLHRRWNPTHTWWGARWSEWMSLACWCKIKTSSMYLERWQIRRKWRL